MSLFLTLFALISVPNPANSFSLPSFPEGSPWQLDISNSNDINPDSSKITQWLQNQGGFGNGKFQVDESMVVLTANHTASLVPFHHDSSYYLPDCNNKVSEIPIPSQGGLEGYYTWTTAAKCEGDCHLIVYDTDSKLIYESFSTKITLNSNKNYPTSITSSCLVVWNTSYLYPTNGRGDGCTSADAAGFPISTLLFTADELNEGEINHAIRFILPNNRMRKGYYVHPGSHFGGPSNTNEYAPIYGSRWRLKSNFNMKGLKNTSKVILTALQKHGMFLADGGSIALAAMSDKYNTMVTYDEIGFGTNDLSDIVKPTDFEVMNGFGPNATKGYYPYCNCVRNS